MKGRLTCLESHSQFGTQVAMNQGLPTPSSPMCSPSKHMALSPLLKLTPRSKRLGGLCHANSGAKAKPKVSRKIRARHLDSRGVEVLPGLETLPGQWDVCRVTSYRNPQAVTGLSHLLTIVIQRTWGSCGPVLPSLIHSTNKLPWAVLMRPCCRNLITIFLCHVLQVWATYSHPQHDTEEAKVACERP